MQNRAHYPSEEKDYNNDDYGYLYAFFYSLFAIVTVSALTILISKVLSLCAGNSPSKKRSKLKPPANFRTLPSKKKNKTTVVTPPSKSQQEIRSSTSSSDEDNFYIQTNGIDKASKKSKKKDLQPKHDEKKSRVVDAIHERNEKKLLKKQLKQAKKQQEKNKAKTNAHIKKNKKSSTALIHSVTKSKKTKKQKVPNHFDTIPRQIYVSKPAAIAITHLPFKTHIALTYLSYHGDFLISFTFEPKNKKILAPFDIFIKSLAFMYHFHRYNLMRRFLLKGDEAKLYASVNMRTLIVHIAGHIDIDPDVIKETQMILSNTLEDEVAKIQQSYREVDDSAKTDLLKMLEKPATAVAPLESIETTPLWHVFNYQKDNLNQHIRARNLASDEVILNNLYYHIIPFMNYLYACAEVNCADNAITREEYIAALKMMYIIYGELFTPERCEQMMTNYPTLSNLNAFMYDCRKSRNLYSHDVVYDENTSTIDLVKLAHFAYAINPSISILDVLPNILSMDDEMEQAEEEKNENALLQTKEDETIDQPTTVNNNNPPPTVTPYHLFSSAQEESENPDETPAEITEIAVTSKKTAWKINATAYHPKSH